MDVLHEPPIGLHQRDNARLLATLKHLRALGNTVMVVEHGEGAINWADPVPEGGRGAGGRGGGGVGEAPPGEIRKTPASLTGQYLSGALEIALPETRRHFDKTRVFRLRGARGNNLKNIDLALPVGLFVCGTGVSGSGKSPLINDTLYHAVARN